MNYEKRNKPMAQRWFVYILRCADGTLYTGITTELQRRLHEHNHEPQGARYTRSRRPVALAYAEEQPTRAAAARREAELKRLDRKSKLELVRSACPGEIK